MHRTQLGATHWPARVCAWLERAPAGIYSGIIRNPISIRFVDALGGQWVLSCAGNGVSIRNGVIAFASFVSDRETELSSVYCGIAFFRITVFNWINPSVVI